MANTQELVNELVYNGLRIPDKMLRIDENTAAPPDTEKSVLETALATFES